MSNILIHENRNLLPCHFRPIFSKKRRAVAAGLGVTECAAAGTWSNVLAVVELGSSAAAARVSVGGRD